MKYFLIPISISILIFTGCVDTYTIKDFKSPQEFYNKINEKVNGRTVKVVTDSNEVYEADKLTISPDSIFFITTKLARLEEFKNSYNYSEIKEMKQKTDYKDGLVHTILLNNGDIITSKSIKIKNDSLFLYDIISGMSSAKKNISLSTTRVNLISFNNRLKGMGEGACFFGIAGFLFGFLDAEITSGDQEAFPPEIGAVAGAIVFGLGGAVVGTVTGSYQDYAINEPDYNYHGFTSVELEGGICNSNMGIAIHGNNSYGGQLLDYSAGLSLVWSFNNELGIKSGIFYSSKGGGFDQLIAPFSFDFHRDVFVNFIEIPFLFQYSFRHTELRPRLYAGPQLGFFLNGRIDNIYDIKEHYLYPYQIYYRTIDPSEVNNPVINFVIGTGFNLQKYITVDLQYEYGLSKFSNSLFDGEVTNLKLNSFSILLGYGL
jgi:hypothetical protein